MAKIKNISKKDNISLDNFCYLISYDYSFDDIGNETMASETKNICFCAELPISSTEFFNAGNVGIKSEKLIVVDSESYQNEETVEYENNNYSVYRCYPRNDGLTELYLNKKAGVLNE